MRVRANARPGILAETSDSKPFEADLRLHINDRRLTASKDYRQRSFIIPTYFFYHLNCVHYIVEKKL